MMIATRPLGRLGLWNQRAAAASLLLLRAVPFAVPLQARRMGGFRDDGGVIRACLRAPRRALRAAPAHDLGGALRCGAGVGVGELGRFARQTHKLEGEFKRGLLGGPLHRRGDAECRVKHGRFFSLLESRVLGAAGDAYMRRHLCRRIEHNESPDDRNIRGARKCFRFQIPPRQLELVEKKYLYLLICTYDTYL